MRRKRRYTQPQKTNFAIVVDGKTEVWYFQMLKRNEPSLQVNIEPKIPQKKSLSEQYKKVCELAENFTKVFWIIDLDVVIAETRSAKKGSKSQIKILEEYLNVLENDFKNVITILNNPCLEFWFVLHFEQTTKYFDKCIKAETHLKKYLKDYEKTQKYFTKQNNDIYLKLKPNLSDALSNTRKTGRINLNELEQGICEMNLFFETEQIKKTID